MVAEPKPHQTGRKRQNVSKTGNDWDYYYDSYYASTAAGFPVGPSPRLVPPLKRPRLMAPPGRPAKIAATGQSQQKTNNNNGSNITTNVVTSANNITLQQGVINNTTTAITTSSNSVANTSVGTTTPASNSIAATGNINNNNATTNVCNINNGALHAIDQLKTYSNPDILICGNCREMFTDLKELIEHKKVYCKLRFTCKCHTFNSNNPPGDEITGLSTTSDTTIASTTVSLLCVQCKDSFPNAWDLMVHAQAAHMVNIYELGIANKQSSNNNIDEISSEPPTSPTDNNQIQIKEDNKNISSSLSNGTSNSSGSDYEGNCLLITNSPTNSTVNDTHHNSNHDDIEDHENVVKIDIDEIMDLDTSTSASTTQSCIMHALTIGTVGDKDCQTSSTRPGDTQPPPIVITNGKQ